MEKGLEQQTPLQFRMDDGVNISNLITCLLYTSPTWGYQFVVKPSAVNTVGQWALCEGPCLLYTSVDHCHIKIFEFVKIVRKAGGDTAGIFAVYFRLQLIIKCIRIVQLRIDKPLSLIHI